MTTCADHTPIPVSYLSKAIWAEAMLARGKTQHLCYECGLWKIWRDGRGIVRREVKLTGKEIDG